MRSAYIVLMPSARETNHRIHVLPTADGVDEPTLGVIKRALHELSRTTSGSVQRGNGANLREAHDLLLKLARRNGIDPDDAVQRRRAAVKAQRERMVLVNATASDQTLS
jgi:hypothetical protein